MPGVQKIVPQGLLAGAAAVERRLELPPHLGLNLVFAAVPRFLRHECAGLVPFRDVHGYQPADFAVAVVLPEQTYGVAPELRL